MQHFECDYMEGAHPQILKRLIETNMEKTPGYGMDPYCQSGREKILKACEDFLHTTAELVRKQNHFVCCKNVKIRFSQD